MSKNTFESRLTGCVTSVVVTLSVVGAVWPALAAQGGSANDGRVLAVPTRRTPDAPPAGPLRLPAGADTITPLTITTLVRRDTQAGGSHTVGQTVSRTSERIHVAGNDGREWLFERNPVDPRRVSATFVDHASQAIVVYQETDLRMALGVRGWADVLALGFDRELLTGYQRTTSVRTIGGIRFARYAAAGTRAPERDVWWSDEQAFPGGFARADSAGTTRFAVESVRAGADATLLRPSSDRFPTYRLFDRADWLEKH